MPRYKIITLIDITRTQATKHEPDDYRLKQQSNFNSLRQAIELRSNVEWLRDPQKKSGRLPDDIEGKATHWIWEFEVERDEVFLKNSDPVGLLKDDIHGVPIIPDLDNSLVIDPAAFQTTGSSTNTWIFML
jgi:hypothetical protein